MPRYLGGVGGSFDEPSVCTLIFFGALILEDALSVFWRRFVRANVLIKLLNFPFLSA